MIFTNLLYGNRFIEILLEVGFIQEMITTCGNKEVPQLFHPQFPLFAKILFTPLDSVLICDVTTGMSWQKFFAD